VERALYACLLVMPLSGFVFVMAGDFGVHFFSAWHLPNVIGANETVALAAQWVHEIGAWMLVLLLLVHWTIAIGHELRHGDRYLNRMLPFTHQMRRPPEGSRPRQ
jgi:cytochrome b561